MFPLTHRYQICGPDKRASFFSNLRDCFSEAFPCLQAGRRQHQKLPARCPMRCWRSAPTGDPTATRSWDRAFRASEIEYARDMGGGDSLSLAQRRLIGDTVWHDLILASLDFKLQNNTICPARLTAQQRSATVAPRIVAAWQQCVLTSFLSSWESHDKQLARTTGTLSFAQLQEKPCLGCCPRDNDLRSFSFNLSAGGGLYSKQPFRRHRCEPG